jgi:glucose/arabinose dehydrogenase
MRVRQLARTLTLAGLTTLLLAACGSTSGTSTDAVAGSASSSAPATPATPAGNGEAAKTGSQVAADAADALASASAVHMVGNGISDGQAPPAPLDLSTLGG